MMTFVGKQPTFESRLKSETELHLALSDMDSLLVPYEAAAHLRVTTGYLAKLRVEGGGPRYVKLAPRVILYRLSDLRSYVESHLRTSTSDPGTEASHG